MRSSHVHHILRVDRGRRRGSRSAPGLRGPTILQAGLQSRLPAQTAEPALPVPASSWRALLARTGIGSPRRLVSVDARLAQGVTPCGPT